MLTTPVDNLNFINDQEIKAMLGHEEIYYSDKIIKIRKGLFNSNQERTILITDQAIYNLKGREKKRRIDIGSLSGITISKTSDQFIIHGKNDEYDYLYSSPNRVKIIEILEIVYESINQDELLFSIQNEKDLSKFVVGKAERKKSPELYKIDPKKFMSIREFIESGGSMNINTHANSLLLEEEFKKGNNYREESLSNFDLKCIIGKGKSATIYLAEYEGEKVALKIFDKLYLFKNDLIERVILEKNILSSFIDKTFLCHLKFYFTTKTKIVFVLPFYQGGDLFNMLIKNGKFDESTVAFYSVQIANIISFLHSKNIAYRDLKLENLMVNEDGYLTLIDFGSCKIVEDQSELESSFVGSPDYMAPEVITGEGHNLMADWWSLGIIIFELLYGIPPFHDERIERCFDLITTSILRFPSKIKANSTSKDIISKLLKKNPNERLGKGEFEQIVAHPFFSSVNIEYVVKKKTSAPRKPEISEDVTANFDKIYLNLEIENLETAVDISLLNQISSLLVEFEN